MTQNIDSFLQATGRIDSLLPPDIREKLGSLSWQERIHRAEWDGSKYKLYFYSDGFDLNLKTKVESILKEALSQEFANHLIYFERKEKTSAPPPSPAQKTPPQEMPKPSGKRPIAGVKRIIAVASGKGGVGKSTVSVNLALSLHNQGYKVGILDADVYGPSLPMMLGIHEDPKVNEQNKIIPPQSFGLKVMSFGFFAPEETAVIWRGPMIMKALQQFFWDVDWGELDFLIIDLPPGTGDAQLTLVQSIPLTGAVIVTTPQNVALLDAIKGIAMFRKTEIPILGVIENMSSFHCPSCGTETHIFGSGGAQKVSDKFEVPLLGHVPLIPEVREAGDSGKPIATQKNHPLRLKFSEIAERVVERAVNG